MKDLKISLCSVACDENVLTAVSCCGLCTLIVVASLSNQLWSGSHDTYHVLRYVQSTCMYLQVRLLRKLQSNRAAREYFRITLQIILLLIHTPVLGISPPRNASAKRGCGLASAARTFTWRTPDPLPPFQAIFSNAPAFGDIYTADLLNVCVPFRLDTAVQRFTTNY